MDAATLRLAQILAGRSGEPDDWWQRQLKAMPFAGGSNFHDDIFRAPPDKRAAQGLDFDVMGSDADPTYQEWAARRYAPPPAMKFR
jgi:hypothetical protein